MWLSLDKENGGNELSWWNLTDRIEHSIVCSDEIVAIRLSKETEETIGERITKWIAILFKKGKGTRIDPIIRLITGKVEKREKGKRKSRENHKTREIEIGVSEIGRKEKRNWRNTWK